MEPEKEKKKQRRRLWGGGGCGGLGLRVLISLELGDLKEDFVGAFQVKLQLLFSLLFGKRPSKELCKNLGFCLGASFWVPKRWKSSQKEFFLHFYGFFLEVRDQTNSSCKNTQRGGRYFLKKGDLSPFPFLFIL